MFQPVYSHLVVERLLFLSLSVTVKDADDAVAVLVSTISGDRKDAKWLDPIVIRETSAEGGFKYRLDQTLSEDIMYT